MISQRILQEISFEITDQVAYETLWWIPEKKIQKNSLNILLRSSSRNLRKNCSEEFISNRWKFRKRDALEKFYKGTVEILLMNESPELFSERIYKRIPRGYFRNNFWRNSHHIWRFSSMNPCLNSWETLEESHWRNFSEYHANPGWTPEIITGRILQRNS